MDRADLEHLLRDAAWQKSPYSSGGGECVEWAHLDDGRTAVRDSKDPGGLILVFTPGEWEAFRKAGRDGLL